LYVSYKDHPKVAMYMVYVREAHPVSEPKDVPEGGALGPANIGQHKDLSDRVLAASACRQGLRLSLPMLIDTMDGVVEKAYRCVPAATAIVDLDGNLVFYARGPNGVQPKKADAVLKKLLSEPGPAADPATPNRTK
jgi:hypothetical protein